MPPSDWPVRKPVRHVLDSYRLWEGTAHGGQCQSWAGGPDLYKKAGWARYGEQAHKKPSSTVPASAPALALPDEGLYPRNK